MMVSFSPKSSAMAAAMSTSKPTMARFDSMMPAKGALPVSTPTRSVSVSPMAGGSSCACFSSGTYLSPAQPANATANTAAHATAAIFKSFPFNETSLHAFTHWALHK